MEFPVTNKQISTRVTNDELEFINELIGKLFPDQDWSDPTLTMRTIFMRIAETADMKLTKTHQSRPEDTARLQELTAENNRLSEENVKLSQQVLQHSNTITQLKAEVEGYKSLVDQLNEEISGISTEKTEVHEKVLKLEKYVPVTNEMRIIIEPLTAKLLALYVEKVSLRTKKEVIAGDVLTKLFTQYITRRYTEFPGWPFLITDNEIVEIAKSVQNG